MRGAVTLSSKTRYELWVGLLLAGALALLAWMAVKVGAVGGMGPQVHITIRMHDAAGITAGASVQTFGVEVGRIDTMSLDPDAAVAHVSIRKDANLPANVVARVRSRSVLGEKYIELTPSKDPPGPLEDGAVLEVIGDQIEIDEIVQKGGTMFNKLDADALSEALNIVMGELRNDPERMSRALTRFDTILENGALSAEKLPAMMEHADATLTKADSLLDALAARADEARAPIAKADAVLSKAESTLDLVPPMVTDAQTTLADARRALEAGRHLAVTSEEAVTRLSKRAEVLMAGFEGFDKWEMRRLLREEGILIRVKASKVDYSPDRTKDIFGSPAVPPPAPKVDAP